MTIWEPIVELLPRPPVTNYARAPAEVPIGQEHDISLKRRLGNYTIWINALTTFGLLFLLAILTWVWFGDTRSGTLRDLILEDALVQVITLCSIFVRLAASRAATIVSLLAAIVLESSSMGGVSFSLAPQISIARYANSGPIGALFTFFTSTFLLGDLGLRDIVDHPRQRDSGIGFRYATWLENNLTILGWQGRNYWTAPLPSAPQFAEWSLPDSWWQAISQLIAPETMPVLAKSTLARDKAIAMMEEAQVLKQADAWDAKSSARRMQRAHGSFFAVRTMGASNENTASRQKSCNACVLGKRRCDKTQPACARCASRGVACHYGRSRTRGPPGATLSSQQIVHGGLDGDTETLATPASFFSPNLDTAMVDNFHIESYLDPDLALEDMFRGFVEDSIGSERSLSLAAEQSTTETELGSLQETTLTRNDYAKVAPMCLTHVVAQEMYQPWHLADPNSNIALTVSAVKSFCPQYAKESCTPYLHKELYRHAMPDCVLKAWTTCLQYSTVTPGNRGMVLRALHQSVVELHQTMSTGVTTAMERLGRLHALMVYQVIRMFDGDITLGNDAARDMPLLEAWATDMLATRDNLDGQHSAGTTQQKPSPPETWERWIFAESVRRTCMMAFMIHTLWRVLARQESTADACIGIWASVHRWTLSRHLWEAGDSYEFYKAWREKPSFVVESFDFAMFLETGKPDDVDSFARILMTMWFGAAEMKEFTSGRVRCDNVE
ncbi:hypothetical protein Micbo1qcDRAFT_219106 [Microdochium bolleyi]|uniref:Zn(2)-C6 fungal-type domain-containing protein n=1 Tax=Microdochium bolleyi TaxID=196109 RepID=A0A136INM9_9PEZI|nr:hypothetical protein Micbo1qcDRAFT_219106 [Microdochium bolleyi]